jgi:hypothetical protein
MLPHATATPVLHGLVDGPLAPLGDLNTYADELDSLEIVGYLPALTVV